MGKLEYKPVPHDHEGFLRKASKRKGFKKAYAELEGEYLLAREMLLARMRSGLTQQTVAERMDTTKSAVSRLESGGKHGPSLRTLKKYAEAVGCRLEVKLVPKSRTLSRIRQRRKPLQTGAPDSVKIIRQIRNKSE